MIGAVRRMIEFRALVIIGAIDKNTEKELIKMHGVEMNPYLEDMVEKGAVKLLEKNGVKKPTLLQKLGLKKS